MELENELLLEKENEYLDDLKMVLKKLKKKGMVGVAPGEAFGPIEQ